MVLIKFIINLMDNIDWIEFSLGSHQSSETHLPTFYKNDFTIRVNYMNIEGSFSPLHPTNMCDSGSLFILFSLSLGYFLDGSPRDTSKTALTSFHKAFWTHLRICRASIVSLFALHFHISEKYSVQHPYFSGSTSFAFCSLGVIFL